MILRGGLLHVLPQDVVLLLHRAEASIIPCDAVLHLLLDRRNSVCGLVDSALGLCFFSFGMVLVLFKPKNAQYRDFQKMTWKFQAAKTRRMYMLGDLELNYFH